MASPKNKWTPIRVGGVLDEQSNPVAVGGGGLTSCQNLTYTRSGAWGKRSGSAVAYTWENQGEFTGDPFISGVRWYRAFPTPQTMTVFAAGGSLWQSGGPGSTPTKLLDFSATPQHRIAFCAMRDPNAMAGTGADVLIICGAQTNKAFATDYLLISGTVGRSPTATLQLQFRANATAPWIPQVADPNQTTYTILPTDNATTIAENLVELINACAAVATSTPDAPNTLTPFMGQCYNTAPSNAFGHPEGSVIHFGALAGGSGGNTIQFQVVIVPGTNGFGTGATIAFTSTGNSNKVSSYTGSPWTGGGGVWYGPLKWDGTNPVDGLSYQIPNGFTGCATWHDHAWFWADAKNPDTVFASDIDQPEGFTFMAQYGGYDIGVGDGDPGVNACVPAGNALYVFKGQNIYPITGYDFQSGEYQFAINPAIVGYGAPSVRAIALLNNALVFWTGRKFVRLAIGSYQPEYIGATIPLTQGVVAGATQSAICAAAGDFLAATKLNGQLFGQGGGVYPMEIQANKVYFSYDSLGNGIPDTVLVYDDDATQRLGKYAWTKWTGWNVAAWLPFATGPRQAGGTDPPILIYLNSPNVLTFNAYQYGALPDVDQGGVPIPWAATTGWVNCGTPELVKNLHRLFLEIISNGATAFLASIMPAQTNLADVQTALAPQLDMVPTAVVSGEAYNIIYAVLSQALLAPAFAFSFSENGQAQSSIEMLSYSLDIVPEEALTP